MAFVRPGFFAAALITFACGSPTQPTLPPLTTAMPQSTSAAQSIAPATTSADDVDGGAPVGSTPAPSALESAALASTTAFDVARSLSEEVGPRLAGSPGDKLAIAWAERTMKELGLENVHTEPVTVPVWKRGVESAEITSPVHQPLSVTALGWSGATPKNGVEGEVLEVTSFDQLKALSKDSAKGKIVFANVVMDRTIDGRGYGTAVPIRLFGPKSAMEAGAIAFINRSAGTGQDRSPHAGSTLLREVAKPIPAAAISNLDADLLHATIARGKTMLRLVLGPEKLPDAKSANVVGEVPGGSKKDEIVLMGAHLDSWDLGRGATDDGAGCGIILAAARAIKEQARTQGRPQARTIRVVLYAAEENSVAGGRAYLDAHRADVDKIKVAFEADTGSDRAFLVQFLIDPKKSELTRDLARGLLPLGINLGPGDGRPGSDVSPLVSAGVPSIEVRQDVARYFDNHHTENDTIDKIDPHVIAQVSAAYAELAYRIAELDGDLGRVPEDKRKRE